MLQEGQTKGEHNNQSSSTSESRLESGQETGVEQGFGLLIEKLEKYEDRNQRFEGFEYESFDLNRNY